jgi:O-antigen ligase
MIRIPVAPAQPMSNSQAVRPAPKPAPAQASSKFGTLMPYGSRILMVFAFLLIVVHLGRVFDVVGVGLHIPAAICGAAILVTLFSDAAMGIMTRTGKAFAAFLVWMTVVIPFSVWKGASVRYVAHFLGMSFVAMLVIAAAPRTLGGLKALFYATFGFGAVDVFIGALFHTEAEGGNRLEFAGTFGNSDDVALLGGFVLCFWIFASSQIKLAFLRIPALLVGSFLLLRVIGLTGTRTAIVGLAAVLAVYFLRANLTGKLMVIAVTLLGSIVLAATLPRSVLERLATIRHSLSAGEAMPQASAELESAMQSTSTRVELMKDALNITFRHPLTGIGPGQFSVYDGEQSGLSYYRTRSWQNTHCVYLQVSSESGIPGLVLYLIFLGTIFHTIQIARKLNLPNAHPDWRLGSQMAACLELAFVYFATSAMFLCATEYIYQFLLAGLALALERISRQRINAVQGNDKDRGTLPVSSPAPPFALPFSPQKAR